MKLLKLQCTDCFFYQVDWLVILLNGISTLVDYLMPNLFFLCYLMHISKLVETIFITYFFQCCCSSAITFYHL